ncbi:MAG: hypothetical protein V3V20_05405 [Algisphaera sp.]
MIIRPLLTVFIVAVAAFLPACQSTNPWAESYSPVNFNAAQLPVEKAQAINVGHVDPQEVYQRDFADALLVGTAKWTGSRAQDERAVTHAQAIGSDLVLFRKTYAGSESKTSYDAYPGYGVGRTSVLVESPNGTRTKVNADSGPMFVPTTRTHRLYRFDAVFLRTADARNTVPE